MMWWLGLRLLSCSCNGRVATSMGFKEVLCFPPFFIAHVLCLCVCVCCCVLSAACGRAPASHPPE